MKNLALSLLIAGSLVMPVAFAADSDMKADAAQTSEPKAMEQDDSHAKKHHAKKHHRGNRHHKKHHGKHHKRHHRHHMNNEACGNGGCNTGQCN